jgi:hypothetical protein
MTRITILILILFSLIAGSCSSRKNKLDHRNLIPEKEMISVITDLYITDGLIMLPKINHWYNALDSISSYREVIEKHGFTKETFDKTMKYYFIKKPKQLIIIYDQVLGIVSKMESRYEKEVVLLQSRVSNLWPGKDFYSFPDPAGIDSTDFDITVSSIGLYIITYTVTLFPDDQSVNPRMTAYTCHPDSIETGKRHYIPTFNYIKDGQPHIYSINVKAGDKSHLHFRGLLYNFDNYPDDWGKHLSIEKISITYTSGSV